MILVIPSFEIFNGKCTSTVKGVENSENIYCDFAEDIVSFCGLLRRENSKSLHIIDKNTYTDNTSNDYNNDNFDLIIKAGESLDIPIQLTAKFNNVKQCRELLNRGIYRLIIDDLLISDPKGVSELINDFTTSNIAIACHYSNGSILSAGQKYELSEFIKRVLAVGANRIVYSNSDWVKASDPDYSELVKLFEKYRLRITLNDPIKRAQHLLDINKFNRYGIDSVIIGKALFENVFPCQNIWRDIECKLEK